jgi:hypothetical protein
MCSYITETLENSPDLAVCYYFCNSNEIGNIPHQILRTLILQLIRQHPDLASLVANEFVYTALSCGMSQLKFLLPRVLEVIPNTRIIIDGIDECSMEDQKIILKDFQTICVGPAISCKILFSSRKEVHIREKLSNTPQIPLDGRQEVGYDICSYVRYKITKLHTSDEDLLKRIESIMVEKADGELISIL